MKSDRVKGDGKVWDLNDGRNPDGFSMPGSEGVALLCSALRNNATLTSLNLKFSPLTGTNLDALCSALAANATVTDLGLSYTRLAPGAGKRIGRFLEMNRGVRRLDLSGNKISDCASVVAALKINHSVRALLLRANLLGVSGACALADPLRVARGLRELFLGENGVMAEGAAAILDCLRSNRLEVLELRDNEIRGPAGLESLKQCSLTTLDLTGNDIGPDGSKTLASAMKVNTTLQVLHLTKNNLGPAGCGFIGDALKVNTSLLSLDLSDRNLGPYGLTQLVGGFVVRPLTHLDVSSNHLGEDSVKHLVAAFRQMSSLQSLDISECGLGPGVCNVVAVLSVAWLGLRRSDVDSAVIVALGNRARQSALTTVDLRENLLRGVDLSPLAALRGLNISATSVGPELAGFAHTRLETLVISSNVMRPCDMALVSKALSDPETRLTSLDVSKNAIGAEGLLRLSETLVANRTLSTLRISNNQFEFADLEPLLRALEVNRTLTSLDAGEAALPLLVEPLQRNLKLFRAWRDVGWVVRRSAALSSVVDALDEISLRRLIFYHFCVPETQKRL
jgi:Ran GTPase-activating protein (RanGAP) involved in mRNA processing and transport